MAYNTFLELTMLKLGKIFLITVIFEKLTVFSSIKTFKITSVSSKPGVKLFNNFGQNFPQVYRRATPPGSWLHSSRRYYKSIHVIDVAISMFSKVLRI